LKQQGFTLVELIAVLVIVGILSVSVLTRLVPSDTLQLQASRDTIVAAFYSAQQLAMTRRASVEVITSANQVDIQLGNASVSFGGVQYPVQLVNGQTLSAVTFAYDRLGHTTGAGLQLSQNGRVVSISVDASGYVR
jgi:prepilin-type N-terminal cleavage/methylation domain